MDVREQVQSYYGQRITRNQGCCTPKVETGRVIGVDMTLEMLERARTGAAQLGLQNVEFREGYIEALPADRPVIEALLEGSDLSPDGLDATELWVLEENDTLLGVVGFESYGETALLRSLVVALERRGGGLAQSLLVRAFTVLHARGFTVAYGLTTTIPELLLKLGFTEISRDTLPEALGASAQLRGARACPASARAFTKQIA